MLVYSTLLALGNMLCGQLGCQALIARWFVEKRGMAQGFSALGNSLGAVIMPPLAVALLATFNWREAFQMLALFLIAVLVPITWMVLGPEPPKAGTTADIEHETAGQWSTKNLLRDHDFWIIAFGIGALMMAFIPVLYGLGVYARDLGISQQQAALIASAGAIAMAAGKLTFGKFADTVEHHHLYWYSSGGVLISVIGVVMASSWLTLMASMIGISFFFGAYIPLFSALIVACFGAASFGRVAGLALNFILLCSSASPFLAGLLQEASGSYKIAFTLMAVPATAGMFAMRWLARPRQTGESVLKPGSAV